MDSILVFRPDHIGDVILTTPALQALRRGFPEAHIAVLIGSWARDILAGNPDIDETIICNLPGLVRGGRARWGTPLALMQRLRRRRFDAIINPRTAASTAFFSRLCGGATRWGFDLPKARWAWTHSIAFAPTRHIVDAGLDLVGAMNCPLLDSPKLRLFPDDQARRQAALLLEDIPSPFIILHQGAGHPGKIWEADRWTQLGNWIADRGHTPVFSGSPDDFCRNNRPQPLHGHGGLGLYAHGRSHAHPGRRSIWANGQPALGPLPQWPPQYRRRKARQLPLLQATEGMCGKKVHENDRHHRGDPRT